MRRLWGAIALVVGLALVGRGLPSAHGQGGDLLSALEPGQLLVLSTTGQMSVVDPADGAVTLLLDLGIGTREAYALALDADGGHAYVLTGPGCCATSERGISYVVAVDLCSGESRIVYEQPNLLGVTVLPGTHQVALEHYAPGLSRVTGSDPVYTCLLDVEAGQCDGADLAEYLHVTWLPGDQFIGTADDSGGRVSYVVDAATWDRRALPVLALAAVPLPGEDAILVTNGIGAGRFTRIDLATLELSDFVLQGDFDPARAFYPLAFAPDSRALLFAYDRAVRIADAQTGEQIAELGALAQAAWLPDSAGVIGLSAPTFLNQSLLTLYRVAIGQMQTIATLDDACAFAVFPAAE